MVLPHFLYTGTDVSVARYLSIIFAIASLGSFADHIWCFIACQNQCDHIHTCSWSLFKARAIIPEIISNLLHTEARTTPKVRAEIKASLLSQAHLAKKHGVTRKTISKWQREHVQDLSHRPHQLHTTLTETQESIAIEIRKRGVAIFAKDFWVSYPKISKNYATAMPSAAPAVLASLVLTQQGVKTSIRK